MIRSFKHRGLKRLFETDDRRKVPAQDVQKLEHILVALNRVKTPEHMDLPGFHLHSLKGDLKGYWSVTVRGNWRVIFMMEKGDAHNVDFIDYH